MLTKKTNTKLRWLSICAIVLIATLLAACGAPAAATTSTPIPPKTVPPTATPIPPTPVPATPTPNPTPKEAKRVPEALFPYGGHVEIGELESEALARNLIGDPTIRQYYVYLPPDYDEASQRYPVVYTLHYYSGHAEDWFYPLAKKLDRLITDGGVPEMIIAAPDAHNKFGGSWYMSSPTIGDYETYITQDFVEHIDANYRTIPDSDSRSVTGCGTGGDGAMHLAFKYPDVFSVVAPLSGFYDYENNPYLNKDISTIKELPEDFSELNKLGFWNMWRIAGAAAAASNPDNPPFYLDMPFTIVNGEAQIVPEVWDRVIELDAMHEARTYRDNLDELNGFLVYHGTHDDEVSLDFAKTFSGLLSEFGIEHDYVEIQGGHCNLDLTPYFELMADHLVYETPEESAEAGSPAAELDSETVDKIEALVEEMMTENEIPGYALGIVIGDEIVYTEGFGVERVDADRPVTPHTVFGTGSVGKTATATAIMQLVAEGKVELDAPITDYLPYFALVDERYSDITVYDLVTSRSGLPDIVDWYPLPIEYDDGALERYVRSLGKVKLMFAPGERWSYSSMGFAVLADIVAKVSGQTFEDYVQEYIIDPLGMSDTLLIVQEKDQEQVASPHTRNDAYEVAVSNNFPYRRQYAPAALLYSSITDMARYAAVHLNDGEFEGTRILPESVYDAMWEPISDTTFRSGPVLTPLSTKFGMGWVIGEMDDHRIVDMLGSDLGYAGALIIAPDDHVAVVMAANYQDDDVFTLSPWETSVAVLDMLLNE